VWNYGSFYLWGDVPALMPKPNKATKSAAGHCKSAVATERPGGRMIAGDVKNSDGTWSSTVGDGVKQMHSRGDNQTCGLTNQAEHDAVKVGGDWFRDPACHSSHASRSNARKAASAMIAKIPLPLSTWIARVYKP
jgi:hypothetical protein